MERASSVSGDDGEASDEASMWHRLFELACHHDQGGALLKVWVAPRLFAACSREVHVGRQERCCRGMSLSAEASRCMCLKIQVSSA